MNVLYDHQAFDMQTHGGVSRSFVELLKHSPESMGTIIGVRETDNVYLQSLGFPPLGYTYEHFVSKSKFPLKRILYKAYYNVKYQHASRWDKRPLLNKYYSEQLLKAGEYDLFHPTFFDNYFLSYIKDRPFVLTIHDMIPELYPDYYARNDIQIIQKKQLAPLASHIITVSEKTKNDVVRILKVPEERISVIYHGVDSSTYVASKTSMFDFEYLLYVGDRQYYKNFMLFCNLCIPVLRRHKELKIVCTGKEFCEDEIAYFKENGVQDRFVHHYVITDQELLDLYHFAIAFVFPSAYEGFGLPILEAYKADCPVVLNRASCFPEIAGDAALYFYGEEGKYDLEEILETLYHMNHNEREKLLELQRKQLQKYSWKNSANALASVYEKCL